MEPKETVEMKLRHKRRKKTMLIFGTIFAVIAVCMLIGTILHATYFKNKKDEIKPYGEMVNVYDGQMHVYKMGNGKETIILIPGMGVALPSADFGPLMRQLSKKFTVVCIEYFGVGFSSQTQRPRTCDNYVEEIRTVLKNANIKTPYVLMPHSISSVYSECYATKYPDEVQAIISLDGTSTAYIGEDMPGFVKSLLSIAKGQQAVGFTSLLAPVAANKKQLLSLGYTENEINDLIAYAGFSINDNTLEQIANSAEYIKYVNKMPYPDKVPYFKIISKKTYETKNSQIKVTPQEYQQEHLVRVGADNDYKILEGTHFIYVNNADRIFEIADRFLSEKMQ